MTGREDEAPCSSYVERFNEVCSVGLEEKGVYFKFYSKLDTETETYSKTRLQ